MTEKDRRPDDLFGVRAPACATCARRSGPWTCSAFPAGIPGRILDGDDAHRDRYPGDGGLRYEPAADAADRADRLTAAGVVGPFHPEPPYTRSAAREPAADGVSA